MSEEKRICRPDSPQDGPMDGVILIADCIRTDFVENPNEDEAMFSQREKSEASISASAEIGTFSIRDKESNVMLTVAFDDAMNVMASAIEAAKEAGTWQNTKEQVESVDTAEEALPS